MTPSPLAYPLRIALRTLRELSHFHLLYHKPRVENDLRIRAWKDLPDRSPQSILVVQLADIGDLVLTSVFLRELRARFPRAKITLAVAPLNADYARLCPHVDAVVDFDFKNMAGPYWKEQLAGCEAWWSAGKHFRQIHFAGHPPDLGFTVRTHRDAVQVASQILLTTSHVFKRVGYPLKTLLGYLRSTHLLDHQVLQNQTDHEVIRQLELLRIAGPPVSNQGALELWTSAETESAADRIWTRIKKAADARYVGLGIGAGRPEKCWPLHCFSQLIIWLELRGYTPLLLGSQADHATGEKLIAVSGSTRCVNLAGESPLKITAAFTKNLHLFIGNDSGPMHLATAARIPVVGIFGPENPNRWGPWPPGPMHLPVAAPDGNLQLLKPEVIQAAILEIEKNL